MKLGCICGTLNRSFDAGATDRVRVHCEAGEPEATGIPRGPAYLKRMRAGG